jgi:hypothetical protein
MPPPFPSVRPLVAVLALATALLTAGEADPGPRPVAVDLTGRAWDCNGQTRVPAGLFGLHAVNLTPELVDDLGVTCSRDINFVPSGGSKLIGGKDGTPDPVKLGLDVYIDCQGDRFYEPLVLRSRDYAEQCAKMGRAYGEFWRGMADRAKHRGIVQWWNEPYLNWAERSAGERGSTIAQQWYDVDRAVEDGPVTIKGWDQPLSHFRWRSRWPVRYEDRTDRQGKTTRVMIVGWSVPIPADLADGATFTAAETRYWRDPGKEKTWTIERHWYPVDPTVVDFWSGRQNLEFYTMMYGPWAAALREANPEVTILAGWDFNYSAGGWRVWTELYRPLLERFPQLVDGLTEHHYGIPPELVQAWYELGTGDAQALTGRWLRNWNTECQGRLDPAVHGAAANAPGASGPAGEQALWEARYNLADIVGLAARLPDKVGSRTAHNFAGKDFPRCGAAWALRLLKDLRGDLIRVVVGDQGLFAVAARTADGTVLALCNSRPWPMTARLAGPGLAGIEVHRLVVTADGTGLAIEAAPATVSDGSGAVDLASRETVVCRLTGLRAAGRSWTKQCFSRETGLREVPAAGLAWTIEIPAEVHGRTRAARLRWVLDGADAATGAMVAIGAGAPLALVPDLPVTDLDLPPAALVPGANVLRFTGTRPYRLVTASLLLDGEE